MQMQWVPTCASLPHDGEPVQLLLHDRQAPMSGAYANGVFRTRWAEYDIDRVRFWREADINPARAQSDHANPVWVWIVGACHKLKSCSAC